MKRCLNVMWQGDYSQIFQVRIKDVGRTQNILKHNWDLQVKLVICVIGVTSLHRKPNAHMAHVLVMDRFLSSVSPTARLHVVVLKHTHSPHITLLCVIQNIIDIT